ncbi:MAG TPA: translation initiation factor IF-2 subunit beta [Candidatus Nanoarchaeia archaeon]|nr:translation initiation factor IF-2 subunit beta [Candidatus Nanoarchaeia archaeon]
MESYNELLSKAYKQIPASTTQGERFELPKVQGHVEGNKTIISNFKAICSVLRREPEHLLKYLQRELATPGLIQDTRLILNRKLSSSSINEKLERYVKDFVLCPECKKPDTQLRKDNKVTTMKCMACGAKQPIKTRI